MKLKPFCSLGGEEYTALLSFAGDMGTAFPLSGYLAGQERGGFYVRGLEDEWASMFGVKHAIACNSATSGLLAASFAIGLRPGDRFACSAMTMSATAVAPMFTGAKPFFCDVEEETFGMANDGEVPWDAPVFVTNLFGHPAYLRQLRSDCDERRVVLIEDNSQSPFAMEHGILTGTIGHIGIFSLNVHKPIQCGEGGMIVTDDDELASRMRAFINHGEHVRADMVGLNLRMPEVCAAIAQVQLRRGPEIVRGRIDQAEAIIAAIGDIPGIRMPITRDDDCLNVFYTIPFLIDPANRPGRVYPNEMRSWFCAALREAGVPIVEGYVPPLYRMKAFERWARPCPVAEDLHDRRLFYFENCAYDVLPEQAEQIGDAFRKAARVLR